MAEILDELQILAGGQDRRPLEPSPLWPHVRLADTDRLESFSDGVFAITITLSVFEIVRPEHEPGQLSLLKIISGRSYDVIRIELAW